MPQGLPLNWRQEVDGILREHLGALGAMILQDVLDETGFREKEPNRREALHLFEVLKRELPSQVLEGHVTDELLKLLFGHNGGTP